MESKTVVYTPEAGGLWRWFRHDGYACTSVAEEWFRPQSFAGYE